MAKRIKYRSSNPTQQITIGYELAFGRLPTESEMKLALEYLVTAKSVDPLADFCHVLLNANEFVYVD